MTRQAFSLLLFGTFTSEEYGGSAGSMVASSSISMLTGQINNWLSHVVKGVDIGVNYRGGDQVTGDDFDLFVRKGIFNDRIVIDANVGRTTDNNNQSSTAAIDASIDVKITQDGRWRFKAFNRSNANDISKNNEYGYTYGVGASYSRSFNRILGMFDNDRRQARKEKKEGKMRNN
ncbi:MAG: translocation/assembly module TamB, partial [Bacteroidales bacterium]|nr:translocation/assembly module TamB [Bacteroidales bacterium]